MLPSPGSLARPSWVAKYIVFFPPAPARAHEGSARSGGYVGVTPRVGPHNITLVRDIDESIVYRAGAGREGPHQDAETGTAANLHPRHQVFAVKSDGR